jgi:hypothetical protein
VDSGAVFVSVNLTGAAVVEAGQYTVRARCRQPVVGSSVATPNYDRGDLTVVASGI